MSCDFIFRCCYTVKKEEELKTKSNAPNESSTTNNADISILAPKTEPIQEFSAKPDITKKPTDDHTAGKSQDNGSVVVNAKIEEDKNAVLNSIRSSKKSSRRASISPAAAVASASPPSGEEAKKEDPKKPVLVEESKALKIVSQKILLVEIKEGLKETLGKMLEITPTGMTNGLRKASDGIVYFGNTAPKTLESDPINDFAVPEADSGLSSKHFKIFYTPDTNEYFIQDMGEGSGTFCKIERKIVLRHGNMISFGIYHLIVTFKPSPLGGDDILCARLVDDAHTDDHYEFNSKKNTITVGRGETAAIRVRNNTLSRVQCRIEYMLGKWYICDGNGLKGSTNGTWLFIEEPMKIYDGMTFKAGQLLFKAKVTNKAKGSEEIIAKQ